MIEINGNYRVTRDNELNIIIQKIIPGKDPSKKSSWKLCGYYPSLRSALVGVLDKQLFETAAEKMLLEDVIARIDSAKSEIIDAINSKTIY